MLLFTPTHAHLSEFADKVKADASKILTKNEQDHFVLIDPARVSYRDCMGRAHIHLVLIDDARRSLEDISTGLNRESDAAFAAP